MSRIGIKPVSIPDGVKVDLSDGTVSVKGPKGSLSQTLPEGIDVSIDGAELRVTRQTEEKKHRALHGLMRSLIANMVHGTTEGFVKVLEVVGTGYRVEEISKTRLKLSLGYSHTIEYDLPEGIVAEIEERGTKITLMGINKQVVGETAAQIRKFRPPEPYKGKGVRYSGEVLRLKAGKSGVKQ